MLNELSSLGRTIAPKAVLPRAAAGGVVGALFVLSLGSSAALAQSIQQQYLPPPNQPAGNQPAASQPAVRQPLTNPPVASPPAANQPVAN